MGNLRIYRKNPRCPFYGFYYSDELQLIPVNRNYCALRRFMQSLDHTCIMENTELGPYFEKCNIAKEILKTPENRKNIQKLEVLTFNLNENTNEGASIVPFDIWFKHVLDGFSLNALIEKYLKI